MVRLKPPLIKRKKPFPKFSRGFEKGKPLSALPWLRIALSVKEDQVN
jgi:hypothetical protein